VLARLAVPAAIGILVVALVLVGALIASRGSGGTPTAAAQIGAFRAPAGHLGAADAALRDRFERRYAHRSTVETGEVVAGHTRVFGAAGVAIAAAPTTTGDVCELVRPGDEATCLRGFADGDALIRRGRLLAALVPDGVVRIELRTRGGATYRVPARDNVYALRLPDARTAIAGYALVYADGHRVAGRP
jgi:hypothetical protein